MIILTPRYRDMSIRKLGSKISKIKKSLSNFWEDADKLSKKKIKFLERNHEKIEDLIDDYNKTFDEDYTMEKI